MRRMLIRNATIVSVDDDIGDLKGDILIDDDRIAAVGVDLVADCEIMDATGMIALPGFVNAHIHTWQAGLRGIAADWSLSEYLAAMHAGLATHFTPDDILVGNRMGALHQLHAGVTTIADWCHNNPTPDHTDAAVEGLKASGIRAVFLHGSPKPNPKPGQPHFSEIPMPRSEVERLQKGPLTSKDALVTLGLAILGPQLSEEHVCRQDLELAVEMGLLASMHVSGPLMKPDGFERLAKKGLLGPAVNIVHGNALTDSDLDLLIDAGVSFSLTPEVEMQMCFGEPLTNRLRVRGGRISLGSDIESAMAGEMFTVARFALQAARHELTREDRAATGAPPRSLAVSTREALRWMTIDGAGMLGLDGRVGSLTPGKQADIVLIDASGINMRPVHDPVASSLFHATAHDVDTVIVAGVIRKQGRHLLEDALDDLISRLEISADRILNSFAPEQYVKRAPE